MKYSFILVNYNGADLTINCVKSLLKQSFLPLVTYIIIVDNNSNADDLEKLSLYCSLVNQNNILLLRLKKNMGYFPAINEGLAFLCSKENLEHHVVVVGNNDLRFPNEFIEKLDSMHFPNDVMVVSPDIITPFNVHQNPHVVDKISLFRKFMYKLYFSHYIVASCMDNISRMIKFRRRKYSRKGYELEQYIKMGFGACYLLMPQFFNKNTRLDDSVFLMGEEALLSHQVYSTGGKMLYTPNLLVYHDDHSTFRKIPSYEVYKITQKSYKHYKKYL